MKTLLGLALLVFSFGILSAQTIQYSLPFDDLHQRDVKLFQCSNGNTLMFTYTGRDGLFVTVYDTTHRLKIKKPITTREWNVRDLETMEIKGVYEISGNVVMFVQQMVEKKPKLFRLIFDSQTGRTIEEKKIGEMDKYTWGENYALSMGSDPKTYFVVKDEYSNCYAVAHFDGLAPKDQAAITVVHYDGSHKEINRVPYLLSKEDDYKFMRYLGMLVDSNRGVYLTTYVFDTRASGGKRSKMFFSKLLSGNNGFTHLPLEMTEDFKETKAAMRFNRSSNTIDMLLLTLTESKTKGKFTHYETVSYYALLKTVVDAATMSLQSAQQLPLKKMADYNRNELKADNDYFGLPMNFIINDDFSTTITFENIVKGVDVKKITLWPNNLCDIGILDLYKSGDEERGYVIRKLQNTYTEVTPFTQYEREKNYTRFVHNYFSTWTNTECYSYDFITTPKGRYVIYTDHVDNFSKKHTEKLEMLRSLEDMQTVCVQLGSEMKKSVLFGQPTQEKQSRYAYISSSHYVPATQTYVVLLVDRIGRERKWRIAWVKFD